MLIPRIGQRDPQLGGPDRDGRSAPAAGGHHPRAGLLSRRSDGTGTDTEKPQIESLRAEVAKVKALKPGDTGTALGAPASYWLDLHGYDPPRGRKALKQPLLILQGERDYQVTMDNFAAWKKALAGRPSVTFKTYPKLNHLFTEGEGKSHPGGVREAGPRRRGRWWRTSRGGSKR